MNGVARAAVAAAPSGHGTHADALRMVLESVSVNAAAFDSVTLEEVGAAALMDRIDTKYLLPLHVMPDVLQQFRGRYRLLEVDGRRLIRYSTRYFDTADLELYRAHHCQRLPRYKVRVRSYVDSSAHYLEVKLKTNRLRTRKIRVAVAEPTSTVVTGLRDAAFAGLPAAAAAALLRDTMLVEFGRLTLVRSDAPERITLDFGLRVSRGTADLCFPNVVIAEVKRERHGHSPFRDVVRQHRVREGALSKYCLGIAMLEPAARRNRFKDTLRRIEAISARGVHSNCRAER